jgi:hypothetical protein
MHEKMATVLAMVVMAVVLVVLVALAELNLPAALAGAGAQTSTSTASLSAPAPTTSKQCYTYPCYGNANRETIYERIGDRKSDLIRAYGNYDRLHANTYSKDRDQAYGFGGSDYIYVDDGDTLDGAHGGWGHDRCYVDAEIEAGNTCERVIVR